MRFSSVHSFFSQSFFPIRVLCKVDDQYNLNRLKNKALRLSRKYNKKWFHELHFFVNTIGKYKLEYLIIVYIPLIYNRYISGFT